MFVSQVPVGPPSEVEEIFDAISYSKGSCVIRMLHDWIGVEVCVFVCVCQSMCGYHYVCDLNVWYLFFFLYQNFRTGMGNYLKKFAYKNAVTGEGENLLEFVVMAPYSLCFVCFIIQKKLYQILLDKKVSCNTLYILVKLR